MIKLFKSIYSLIEGHYTVFKHLFKKAVTVQYPENHRMLNNEFRGRPVVKGCIGCGICKKVCPAGAIDFEKDDKGRVYSYTFDLNKCIFCGNCKYYCPNSAIKMTTDYELGTVNKECLKLKYYGGNND